MTQNKVTYELTTDESMSSAVTQTIADQKGIDPVNLDERLYDHVDPNALDRLFDATGSTGMSRNGRVTFRMAGYRVEIEGTQRVIVTPLPDSAGSAEEVRS